MPDTNTLAYYENPSITAVKAFIVLAPGECLVPKVSVESEVARVSARAANLVKKERNVILDVPGPGLQNFLQL